MRGSVQRLFQTLSVVAAMVLVSEVILAVVFYLSGTVTAGKLNDIAKVLRGSLASSPEQAETVQSPKQPLEMKSQEELQTAVEEWEKSRKSQEEALAAQRDAVESMKRELEGVRAETDAREKSLNDRIVAFESRKQAEEAAAADEGFKLAVATYAAMEAKDVAALLSRLEDGPVVRYLKAFKTAFRAEVLTEIKKLDDANPPAAGSAKPNRAARLQEIISGGNAVPSEAVAAASK